MRKPIRIFLALLLIAPFPALVWSQEAGKVVSTVYAPSGPISSQTKPDPAPERQADQMTNIPYFSLRHGLSSMLTVDNNAPTPTKATITIFNNQGRALVLDPMTLDPHSVKQIEISNLVSSELYDEGS